MWTWRIIFVLCLFAVLFGVGQFGTTPAGQAYPLWLRATMAALLVGAITFLFIRFGVVRRMQ